MAGQGIQAKIRIEVLLDGWPRIQANICIEVVVS